MELKNKRVLIVGLGKSGKSGALFLRDRGARIVLSAIALPAWLTKLHHL
jgi:UDP-N-acetylmuramoylalanine--D-glutamate ligase